MSSPLALAVAAWFARSRAAFEVSVPVVWYRRFLVKYVDWCNSVCVLRWLVRIAKFGLVIAAVGLAWNVDLRSVLRVPVPDAWQYGYLVALVVVLAVMFVVAVPGFILIRAVRAVLLAVGVALVPVAFLVVYMWSFHAIDIRTVRAAQFLSNGWESGHALPWSLAFVVVAVHAGWAGLAGWLLWHPERAVAVVHAVVVVPLWIVARLAVPIVVTWVLVEEFFGAPSDVLVWARDRVRELAGVHPAVRAGFRTVDLVVGDATTYAVGILTGVVAVFGVWSALDLVRVVCMQFVRHVDGARELRRIFPLLPREGIAQGAGGGGADGDVVVDLPPVAAGAAGAGARFERSVDPVDAAERALRGELLSTQAAVLDAKRRALDEEITKLSDIDANLDLSLSSLERERELAGDPPLDRGPDAHRPAFEHADPVVPGARRPAPDPVELPPEKAPAVAAERPGPQPIRLRQGTRRGPHPRHARARARRARRGRGSSSRSTRGARSSNIRARVARCRARGRSLRRWTQRRRASRRWFRRRGRPRRSRSCAPPSRRIVGLEAEGGGGQLERVEFIGRRGGRRGSAAASRQGPRPSPRRPRRSGRPRAGGHRGRRRSSPRSRPEVAQAERDCIERSHAHRLVVFRGRDEHPLAIAELECLERPVDWVDEPTGGRRPRARRPGASPGGRHGALMVKALRTPSRARA